MTQGRKVSLKTAVASSVLALAIGVAGTAAYNIAIPYGNAAWAEGTEGGGGHDGKAGQGQGQQGENGQHGANAGQGQGQGGPGPESDGKGPQAGASGANGGGKPNWAQEGIPAVELGRLSVARSPSAVLDRAYAEALASFSEEIAAFYNMSLEDVIMALSTNFDEQTYIDSPLQNLALLKDALDGTIALPGVTNTVPTLEAIFLGVASDKTIPITTDTVIAVTTILGTPITGDEAAALAAQAEAVRIAVLAGHG